MSLHMISVVIYVISGYNLFRHMIQQDLLILRPEKLSDIDAIFKVNLMAFETDFEAHWVNSLREKDILSLSLVEKYHKRIIGHILLIPVEIKFNPEGINTVGLAPMAILPKFQRQGVGSFLVNYGFEFCKKNGQDIVFVVGHTDYYPRFGFYRSFIRIVL
jgi:putative acetyltransferase